MRQSILLPTLACLILIVEHRAHGNSSGAPEESCDSLTVTHTHVGSPAPGAVCDATCRQVRQLRWIGNPSADSFIYNCNETYQLQLTTTDPGDESLNGYMVSPREDTGTIFDGNALYVGSWETGTDVKLQCDGQAVTQPKALDKIKTVNMTWKAPMYGFQNVAFWFVIVPSTAFYYLPVKSLTATPNHSQCSCPPGECAMNTTATDIQCVVPNNSLCNSGEVFNEAKCQCENCSLSIFCMNYGMLNLSTCTCDCPETYSGMLCENCTRMCDNGGSLDTDNCTCDCVDGFSGENCENCSRVCMNGGNLDEGNCTCACANGYIGDNCEICSRVCQNEGALNNGTCMCDCADGYSGPNCENCSRMCMNGGRLDEGNCTCGCAGGFSGPNCEACLLMCQNGGTHNEATCTCACADGYSGDTCGTCSRMCQNGGTLNEGACTCDCVGGFSGANCETCPLTCEEHGTLNMVTCTCDCADGYSGDTCGTCSRSCENGATLKSDSCTCGCADGYGGDNCRDCNRVCHNGGTLNSGACTCDCEGSFSGQSCEIRPADQSAIVLPAVIGTVGGIIIITAISGITLTLVCIWIGKDKLCKCHTFKVETSGKNDTTLQEGVGYVGVNPSAEDGGACTSEEKL